MKKKALSLLLVLVMVLSMLPVSSLATGLWGNLELSENLTAEAEEITLADSSAQTKPFPSGTLGSEKFRIPSIVTLNDGTIVAAADARWNDSTDGGGIDTIVSISKDNGATWTSSFANYLADNNKAYNVNSATFIDPALASDGKKLYMLVDLYPAGYSNLGYSETSEFTLQSTENGFDSQGRLIISKGTGSRSTTTGGYYLGEFGTDGFASIYSTSGAAVACYKVDRWFNLYKDDEKVSNLYYYGADYQAFPVQYLYQTESTDGGQTWSAPKLLNLKQNGEVFCGVCPGSGYVTSTGRIIFLVYDCARIFGSMQTSVVYSDDQGKTWHRGAAIGNDGQMSEATLSEVYLKGNCYLYALGRGNNSYFVSSDDGETWTSATSTGLSYQTGSAMGSITYSKLIDGCPAIILAAPSGSASRTAGKLYVGLVQSDGTIDWKYTYAVNGSSYYAYSDLIELSNGSIGLLYESDSAAITFKELPISDIAQGATIGEAAFPEIVTVNDTTSTSGISVTAPGLISLSVEPQEGVTIEDAENVLAYDITPKTDYGKYTGKASVTFTLPEDWSDSARIKGFVENSSGVFDTLDASVADGAATVTFPHFSVGGIYYVADNKDDVTDGAVTSEVDVTLDVGGTAEYRIEGSYITSYDDTKSGIVTTTLGGEQAQEETVTYTAKSNVSNGDLISNNSSTWIPTGYYCIPDGENYYPLYAKRSSTSGIFPTYTYTYGYSTDGTNNATQFTTAEGSFWSTGTPGFIVYTQTTTPGQAAYTTVSFVAQNPGTTTVTVGSTAYNITVNKQTKTVNVKPGASIEIEDASTQIVKAPDPKYAKATLSNNKLTIEGVAEGTTTIETDTTIYTVVVKNVIVVNDKENSPFIGASDNQKNEASNYEQYQLVPSDGEPITKLTISKGLSFHVDLDSSYFEDGSVISWEIEDSSIASVDENGIVKAKEVGETSLKVTIDGVSYQIPVVVLDTDGNEEIHHYYFVEITNTTVYYSINCASLIEAIEGEVVYVTRGDHFGVDFFGAPDEGYALTSMGSTLSGDNPIFSPLRDSDGNPDYSGSDSFYKSPHVSSNLISVGCTDDEIRKMIEEACSKGCDGGQGFAGSKNTASGMLFRSEKLPTISKDVVSVNGVPYEPGMTAKLGDVILFKVVVSKYPSTGALSYTNAKLVEADGFTFGSSTEQDITTTLNSDVSAETAYEYDVSYTVVAGDLNKTIKNTVGFSYSYSSKFSKGSMNATANAEASISAVKFNPSSVIADFGLPVTCDFTKGLQESDVHTLSVNSGSATYGTVSIDGLSVTYTPNKSFVSCTAYDTVTFKNTEGGLYSFKVIPASNILLEENYFTAASDWVHVGDTPKNAQQVQEAGKEGYVFGYDKVYDSATGAQGYYEATDLSTSAITGQLTTSFYGNAFDLIGNCGPDTGRVLMLISGNSKNYIYDVDTRYSAGTLNQVPLAHAELGTDANYTVKISAAGLAASASANANAASTFSVSGSADALTLFLAENDLTAADVEIISVTPELVAYASAVSVNDLAEATATVSHAAGTHVEIDAFRVYRSSSNENYPTAEKDVKYVNCLDAVNGQVLTAYAEGGTVTDIAVGEYEGSGGPQNEIYLAKNQSVTFGVTGMKVVQVSLRAVSGETTWNTTNTIKSNTEMYYNVTADENGLFTVTNTGNNLLAIGNLKLESGAIVQPASDFSTEMLLRSVQATMASAPVETEPEYDPFVDVKLRTTSLLRKKLVTLTITTSTDVESLTVNGYKLNPVNKWMVQTGRATTYTYILADTVSKNTTKTYEITAVNANGQSCTVTKQA